MERDGELNKEFRKEILGGDSHEKHELDEANAEQIITDMFKRFDLGFSRMRNFFKKEKFLTDRTNPFKEPLDY